MILLFLNLNFITRTKQPVNPRTSVHHLEFNFTMGITTNRLNASNFTFDIKKNKKETALRSHLRRWMKQKVDALVKESAGGNFLHTSTVRLESLTCLVKLIARLALR